jgi:hypothetical protein
VAAAKGDRVRLGTCAPATVRVNRQEVHEWRSFSLCLQTPGLRGSLPSQEDDGCRG